MSKNHGELHQRAAPKPARVLNIAEERDDGAERQVQRVPAFDPVSPDSATPPERPGQNLVSQDAGVENGRLSGPIATAEETPHVQVETDEAKEARLDRQWKQLKLDAADLPGIYSRLSKIKLTGMRSSCCHFAPFKTTRVLLSNETSFG